MSAPMTPREVLARAIVQADEQNGGGPWDWVMSHGKHVTGAVWDRADAALAALAAAGFAVVPVVATETMSDAATARHPHQDWFSVWAAMIAAAEGEMR